MVFGVACRIFIQNSEFDALAGNTCARRPAMNLRRKILNEIGTPNLTVSTEMIRINPSARLSFAKAV